jgi:DNA-directed RNA polymerase specialized sigma24 family protein
MIRIGWPPVLEEYRNRLRAVAYRMLGSLSEADDIIPRFWR